jgi:hypothetical protein
MRNVSDKIVEKTKTQVWVQKLFFSFENTAVYEVMWKNAAELGRLQMTI